VRSSSRSPGRSGRGSGSATSTQTQRRIHVSLDGEHTVCGSLIPDHATTVTTTTDWHLHTNCYNCAYRLWPKHAPAGYERPTSSRDFPLRRTSKTWEQLDAARACSKFGSSGGLQAPDPQDGSA
jgi:hypothetical protein